MEIDIHVVPLGVDNCYLLQAGGTVMVDGGAPNKLKAFEKALDRIGIQPEAIDLLLITHGHWDHIGSAAAIKQLTGAKIAMHEADKALLEQGSKAMPPGVTAWGKVFGGVLKAMLPLAKITPAAVDIVVGSAGLSLADYGIPGRVVHTPGHSAGSLSVFLQTGDVFVGDLAMNGFPLRRGPGLPAFAEDLEQVKASWRTLLEWGAKTVYPAHGKPFPATVMKRAVGMPAA